MQVVKKIDLSIYNQSITLCYGSAEDFEDYMRNKMKIKIEVSHGVTGKTLEVKTVRGRELYLFINSDYVSHMDNYFTTVTHEIYHLVAYVLRYAGVSYDMDNDEPGAYLTGYINSELYKIFAKEFED